MTPPSLPEPYWYLWAKSGQEGDKPPFHPLICHLIDVAMVARAMWETALSPALRTRIARTLGLSEEQAGAWVSFLAGSHDLGKASPAFAAEWEGKQNPVLRAGFHIPRHKKIHHGILTTTALAKLFCSNGVPERLSQRLAVTVGGHHGLFPDSNQWVFANSAALGTGRWEEAREALFHTLKAVCNLAEGCVPTREVEQDHWLFIILAGLTSVADWIGSDQDHFPFAHVGVPLDQYAQQSLGQAQKALRTLGWAGSAPPQSDATFEEIFQRPPRPMQEDVVAIADALQPPFLTILEAPMGLGKTEAALYIADRLARRTGQPGFYFALPTQAASNPMFSRVAAYLRRRHGDQIVNLQLLHGHAALSVEFQRLRTDAALLLNPEGVYGDAGYDGAPAGVVAAEWFTYAKRGLLAPFGVGTIDQALLAVLQTRHFFVRLFGLGQRTLIVDEVHAYDTYMSRLLEHLLTWLAALGTSVILLSATLPRERRERLLRAYAHGAGAEPQDVLEAAYPRMSWYSAGRFQDRHLRAGDEQGLPVRLRTIDTADDYDHLARKLQAALADRGCAAVICNTVGQAQAVYQALQTSFAGCDPADGRPVLELFHAHTLFGDRAWREARALIRFGKEGEKVACPDGVERPVTRPHRAVLVATQVVEQSLDLDFDLMVSFFAPVDLLLQRAGRLQRHRRERPPALRTPELWLIGVTEDETGMPRFAKGTEAVYERHVLLRSWLTLRGREDIAIPGDIERLVEAAYGGPEEPPANLSEALRKDWSASLQRLMSKRDDQTGEAEGRLVGAPDEPKDLLDQFSRQLEEEADPSVAQKIQALTRLTRPSVRVICLYGTPDRPTLDPDGTRPVARTGRPSLEEARALLERSVTITHRGFVDYLLGTAKPLPAWRHSPLLRHHLPLFFGRGDLCEMGPWRVRIDEALGVTLANVPEEVDE